MNIKGNIRAVAKAIDDGNDDLGMKIGNAAILAITSGMKSGIPGHPSDWEKLMDFFANPVKGSPAYVEEMDRLCGRDTDFLNVTYGKYCLAYIAGDSTCGSDTTGTTGTLRTILMHDKKAGRPEMQNLLDATDGTVKRILAAEKAAAKLAGAETAAALTAKVDDVESHAKS